MRAEIQILGFMTKSDAWSELCNLKPSDSWLRWQNVKMQLGGGIVCSACACGCGSVSEMCNSWKWSRKFFLLTILGFRNNKFCFIDHRSKIWGLTVLFNRNEIKSSSYLGMKRKCDFCAFMRVISTKWVKLILDHLFGMYSDSLRTRSFASPIASPSW